MRSRRPSQRRQAGDSERRGFPSGGVLFARRIPPATTALHRASLASEGDGRGHPRGSLISKPASACPFVRRRGRRTDEIPKPKAAWKTWDRFERPRERLWRERQDVAQQISPGSGIHRPLRLCGERVNPSSIRRMGKRSVRRVRCLPHTSGLVDSPSFNKAWHPWS
jgi:hypothetical protein